MRRRGEARSSETLSGRIRLEFAVCAPLTEVANCYRLDSPEKIAFKFQFCLKYPQLLAIVVALHLSYARDDGLEERIR